MTTTASWDAHTANGQIHCTVIGTAVEQPSAALDSIEWRNPGVDANSLRD